MPGGDTFKVDRWDAVALTGVGAALWGVYGLWGSHVAALCMGVLLVTVAILKMR